MLKAILASSLVGSALLFTASASAQEASSSGSRIAEIIVYGNDPCPRSTDDEVVVCARKPEGERYRIPERLRTGGALQTRQAWANRARSFEIATRRGIATCDAVGPSGQNGCLQKMIDQAAAEQREAAEGNTPPEM